MFDLCLNRDQLYEDTSNKDPTTIIKLLYTHEAVIQPLTNGVAAAVNIKLTSRCKMQVAGLINNYGNTFQPQFDSRFPLLAPQFGLLFIVITCLIYVICCRYSLGRSMVTGRFPRIFYPRNCRCCEMNWQQEALTPFSWTPGTARIVMLFHQYQSFNRYLQSSSISTTK